MGRAGEPEPVGATSPPDPTALAPVLCSLLMWVMTTGTRPLWEERQLRLGGGPPGSVLPSLFSPLSPPHLCYPLGVLASARLVTAASTVKSRGHWSPAVTMGLSALKVLGPLSILKVSPNLKQHEKNKDNADIFP